MQVSVEVTQGLGRKMTVSLPSEQFEKAYDERLKSLAKTSKMPGFRPGKVPIKVIQQKYGASVRQEILSDLIQNSYGQALGQEKLHPAGMPHIDSKPPNIGEDVKFTAEFEVFPEITLSDFGKLKIVKASVDIDAKDIDQNIERLRQQRATWKPVARAAKKGDQVKIDFNGTIDGEAFDGGKGEDVTVELGSGQMLEDFERQLEGIAVDQQREFKIKFPKDYMSESLRGKKALFSVSCNAVLEQELPELNEEFAKSYGAEDGSVDSLRNRIDEYLQRERDQHIRAYLKEQVMDGLVDLHKIELPNVMLDAEIESLQQQAAQRMGMKKIDIDKLPRDGFEERARRRVHLGLVVNKLTETNSMKPDQEKVQELMMQSVAGYENPEQMLQYYMGNREFMQQFHSMALEEQVVDFVLEQAKVSEKSMALDQLLKRNQAK